MKRLVKPVSILILIAYLMTIPISAFAAASTTSPASSSSLLDKWKGYGFIDKGTTVANLNEPAQKIDFIMLLNNILKPSKQADIGFNDVPAGSWYGAEISKAVAAGYIDNNNKANYGPFTNITRLEASLMAVRVFGLELSDNKIKSKINDAETLNDQQLTYFAALVENGGISEVSSGRYAPTGVLKLIDALKMLDACLGEIVTKPATITNNASGNMLITAGSVNLKNIEIGGNLTIGEGVANGSVRLENVSIKGRLIVRGGGSGGITLKNTQINRNMIVEKSAGDVHISVSGNTTISDTFLKSGCSLEEGTLTGGGKGFVDINAGQSVNEGQTANLKGIYNKILSDDSNININLNGNAESVDIAKKSTGKFTLTGGEAKTISMKATKGNIDILGGTVNSLNIETGAKSNKITINGTATIKAISAKEVTTVDFIKGTVEKLAIEPTAENSYLSMVSGSYLKNLIVNAAATVTGFGKIDNAYIYSNNVKLNIWPSGIYVSNGTVTNPGGNNPSLPQVPVVNPNPSISLKEGETRSANVSVSEDLDKVCSFGYISSDNSIATVSNKGEITGVSVGQTKIHVTVEHPAFNPAVATIAVNVTSGNMTAAGSLTISPDAWETGEPKDLTLTYTAGDNMANGTVVIKLPEGFSAYESDTVIINGGEEKVLDKSQRPNSQTLSFTNLNMKANEGTIVVKLKNKIIPAGGKYEFTSISDADGQGPKLPTSDGAEKAVFTANKLKVLVQGENSNYTNPEPGSAAGTAKIRKLSFIGLTGANKWVVKVQDDAFAIPVFDEVISGTAYNPYYNQGDNIAAAAGQHLLLAAVGDGDKVKAYAIITITPEMIRKNDADKLKEGKNYKTPEPGVKANTTRIRGLQLEGIDTAAERWMIKVQNTEVPYIFADEVFEGAQSYEDGSDISAYEGQYIVLAAVDNSSRIKAYADIRVTGDMLSKPANDLKLDNNFSAPEYGSVEGTTMIKTLNKGGYDIDKWLVVTLDKTSVIPGLNIPASEFERYTGSKKFNQYEAGKDIPAEEGQYLLLVGVKTSGENGKTDVIKAYVYLPVDSGAVRKPNASEIPDENFSAPVMGSVQYTTRIQTLSLTTPKKINEAEKFMIKVQNSELVAPQFNSRLSGASDYAANQDIPVSDGQILVLLATDNSGRIKAYKNIPVSMKDGQIKPADAMKLINPNDYQMTRGKETNSTSIILPGSDPEGIKGWRYKVQSTPFEIPYKGSKIEEAFIYTRGDDIKNVSIGQHLLLLAVDSDGKTVAYADEILDSNEIRQPQAKLLKSNENGEEDYNYSMPEPGHTGGTTRITSLSRIGIQDATKWLYKIAESGITAPDYNGTMTGLYPYNSESVKVNEGQYFVLFAVDDQNRIKAYASIKITAGQIRTPDAIELFPPYDYAKPKPGSDEGTTVISSLSFKNIEGYDDSVWKWRYAIGNTQFPAPQKDSKVKNIAGLKDDLLTTGTNIKISAGQYILLLAVDGSSEDSLIKGYANIYVAESDIKPGNAAIIPDTSYSLAKGTSEGATRFSRLDFIGLPSDATNWMILTQKGDFQTPVGKNTTVAGAKPYNHNTMPDIPVEVGSKVLLLATDSLYKVKAYAVIEVKEEHIQAPFAMRLEYISGYTGPYMGTDEGTTKFTLIEDNIPKKDAETIVWKYKTGAQEFAVPHMGDDASAYNLTASGADIPVEPNNVLLIAATIDNKIKAYFQIRVVSDSIKPKEAPKLKEGVHYSALVKGSKPGTTKIEGLDPRGLTGFAGWAVKVAAVEQKPVMNSYFGSPLSSIGDIEVKAGQHFVLAAVDSDGRVKAYVDIPVTDSMINPPTADRLEAGKHYTAPKYGSVKGTTSIYVSPEGINGAKEFAVMVVNSEENIVAGSKIDYKNFHVYDSGTDIAIKDGQYILLVAVDDGDNALAYANIKVDGTAIRPDNAYRLKTPGNYSELEPGAGVGTTKFRSLNFLGLSGSDLKWAVKVLENDIAEAPLLDSSVEGVKVYSANTDIAVKEGQYVILYAMDAVGKIKGYANVKVLSSSVRGVAPLLKAGTNPGDNYSMPEPGTEINTVKIAELNLPEGAAQWKYAVSDSPAGAILKDSQPAGYSDYFKGADIATAEGQHLILIAADKGLVKAYADITVTSSMLRNVEAVLSGTIKTVPTGESHIMSGGRTVVIQLQYGEWQDDVLTNAAKRNALYEGLSAATEQSQWLKVTDALKKEGQSAAVMSADKKVITITMSEAPTYDIAENQEVSLTIKPELIKGGTKAVSAQNKIVISADVIAQLVGSEITLSEGDIVAGGKTIIIELKSGEFAQDVASDPDKRNAIFEGLKASSGDTEWSKVIKALKLAGENAIGRNSKRKVTITLQPIPAEENYDINLNSIVKVIVPYKTAGGKEILVGAIKDAEAAGTLTVTANSSAALTGTLMQKPVPESAIVSGGRTLIITLTDGQWVTDIKSNKTKRDALFNGLTSTDTTARNALVKALVDTGETAVERTDDNKLTITLPPVPSYNITNNQSITMLIPAACMIGAKANLNAGDIVIEREASATLSGTVGGAKETDIRTGGKTLIITLKDAAWINTIETNADALLEGFKAAPESGQWKNVIDNLKGGQGVIKRTSATVLTITLPASNYDIAANQTITLTIPASAVTGTSFDIPATGSLTINSTLPTAAKVTEVSGPTGFYKQGDVIQIKVIFDTEVDVIGKPVIYLETGAVDRDVEYTSGTGSKELIFEYTVQAGDVNQKLNYRTTSIGLTGATIRNRGTTVNANAALPALTATNALGSSNICVDAVAPAFAATYPKAGSMTAETADISVKLNEKATVYYVAVLDDGSNNVPSVDQVIAGKDKSDTSVANNMKGTLSVEANTEGKIQIIELTEYTKYKVYIVAADVLGNKSASVTALSIETKDVTAPEFASGYPAQQDEWDNKIVIKVKANEAGKVYLAALPAGAAGLTSAQVKAAKTGAGGVIIALSAPIAKDAESLVTLSPLNVSSTYDIYVVIEDAFGNAIENPVKIVGTTSKLNLKNVGADLAESILTDTTAQMQYSFNGQDWKACSEKSTKITYNENAEVFIVYIREAANTENMEEIILSREDSALIDLSQIDYDIAAGTIKNNSDRNLHFKVYEGVWKALNAKATVKNVEFVRGAIMIRTASTPAPDSKLPSAERVLDNIPEPMPAPNVELDDVNNVIKGLEGIHEYSMNNGDTWTSGLVEGDFSGTKTVLVREKATKYKLPSNYKTLKFTAGKIVVSAFPGSKNTPAGKNFITITFEENTNKKDLSIQNFKDYFKAGTGVWDAANNKFANEHIWKNIAKPVWTAANVLKVEFDDMDGTTVKIGDEIRVLADAGITNAAGTSGNYTPVGKLSGSFHTEPRIVSIKAMKTTNDANFPNGGQLVITFDQDTNHPSINASNIADCLTLKDSAGKEGLEWDTGTGNLNVKWTALDTLTVTLNDVTKTQAAVGCKVIVNTAWGLKDKDETTRVSDTSAIIGGSFAKPLKITSAVISNKAEGKAGLMEVGDKITITFNQATNKKAITQTILFNNFKLLGKDGKTHSWGGQQSDIAWSSNDTLTITLTDITNVTLTSGDTLTITAGAGIKVEKDGSDACEDSITIKGDY